MIPILASDIIARVRQFLDQVPFSDEDVQTDSSVFGSSSTDFSDPNILDRVNDAHRALISKVKAQHVPLAVTRYDTAAGATLPEINIKYIRLLLSRVLYTGEAGDPTNNAPYDPQGFFAGSPDDNEIMYQLIAGRVINVTDMLVTSTINPSIMGTLGIEVDGTSVGTITLNTSGSHVTSIGTGFTILTGQVLQIINQTAGVGGSGYNFSFTATAEVFDVDTVEGVRALRRSVDRHRRLQNTSNSTGDTPGRLATGQYPVYTWDDAELQVYPDATSVVAFFVGSPEDITITQVNDGSDYLLVDERFLLALTAHVAASCYHTLKQTAAEELHMQLFEDEIRPYSLRNRINKLIDDREVDVE